MKEAKSVVGFSVSANFELDGMSHKHDQVAKYSLKMVASQVKFWAVFETNFFRMAGTLEAATSVPVENSMFICYS